ncbi:MAG: hypothetical protein Q9195_000175 [Heterodermia aff. obscurata]
MAGVTSLLGKLTLASSISDDVATIQPLLSLPQEVFQEILKLTSQADRISMSQTCRMLRYSPGMERALLREPLSRSDLPMTYEQSSDSKSLHNSKESVWGYTEHLHDNLKLGPRINQAQKYLTARQYYHYCSTLNEANGGCVRKLTISNFLTIENVQRFAKLCPKILHLDLASFMPAIDSKQAYKLSDSKKVTWEGLLKKCPEIFNNARYIRVGYAGDDSAFGPKGLRSLATLLGQARQLECLEICFKAPLCHSSKDSEYSRVPGLSFVVPQLASILIQCLATNASQRLTELRLDNMVVAIRNPYLFIEKLGESLPNLAKIGTTINKDLQALGHGVHDGYPRVSIPTPVANWTPWPYATPLVFNTTHFDANSTPFTAALFQQTARTCWQYLRALAHLAGSPRWTVTSLDSGDVHSLSPHSLFRHSDTERQYYPPEDNVQLFRFLRETCNWLPVFDWNEEMDGVYYKLHGTRQPLCRRQKNERNRHLQQIRVLFQNLREAGIPTQLLLSTRSNDPVAEVHHWISADHGACFTNPSETDPGVIVNNNPFHGYNNGGPALRGELPEGIGNDNLYYAYNNRGPLIRSCDDDGVASISHVRDPNIYFLRNCTRWYLEDVEDLVDQFMVFDRAQPDVILLDHAFVLDRSGAIEIKKRREQIAIAKQNRPTNKRNIARYKALLESDD